MRVEMAERRRLEVQGKRVAVIGLGRSGRSAVDLLLELGADIAIADQRPTTEMAAALGELDTGHIEVHGGGAYERALHGADLALLSPGVPLALKPLQAARAQGLRIVGELELASQYVDGRLIAVTGTNGKSTTVTLIGELLRASGYDPFVGGNLGTPLTQAALASLHGRHWDFVVAEVSSFQLETIETFHPWIAAILNITPDHLDRYPSVHAYAAAKARLVENQTMEDYAILNADDPGLLEFSPKTIAPIVQFSRKGPVKAGVYVQGDRILTNLKGLAQEIIQVADLQLRGVHNLENAAAASAAAILAGCSVDSVNRGLRGFRGLEHVMEVVRVLRGVTYINDSKGTNVDATVKALESLPRSVILIAGGREKGGAYPGLREAAGGKVKQAILIGEAREHLRKVLSGVCPVSDARSLADAVRQAAALAVSGDTVLLSPVCASFDMFVDYKDRGRQFKEQINELA
jgi:UDP-N-acetylmuramoylalanine--D-glutamate ligase